MMADGRSQSYSDLWESAFKETPRARLRRWVLGLGYALMPKRISLVPRLLLMTVAYWMRPRRSRDLLPEHPVYYGPRGLIGVSNDLSVETMLARYRRGWFPICHIGPMKWWCPEERAVISPSELRIEKGVRRLLRQKRFLITFDEDFAAVMTACATPRPGKTPLTWITPQIMRAFLQLHEAGYAHSVEVWDDDSRLIAGLYGLAIGGVFFAESRFARADNASKLAVTILHHHLARWGFGSRDAKWMSPQLAALGFHSVSRADFNTMLEEYAFRPSLVGRWEIDETLDTANWDGGRGDQFAEHIGAKGRSERTSA